MLSISVIFFINLIIMDNYKICIEEEKDILIAMHMQGKLVSHSKSSQFICESIDMYMII